ncbi:hypothetical protein WN51_12526 [Melipona quadrifasciata]|uniref:Uncharacterized protein n=1 Tax=Melipona quadrifasciata TaxID=166423 RepID=A0A0M9A539_9HYME|nr:hypothetical protein WN51_12526 [Melipona quadrifasciata]
MDCVFKYASGTSILIGAHMNRKEVYERIYDKGSLSGDRGSLKDSITSTELALAVATAGTYVKQKRYGGAHSYDLYGSSVLQQLPERLLLQIGSWSDISPRGSTCCMPATGPLGSSPPPPRNYGVQKYNQLKYVEVKMREASKRLSVAGISRIMHLVKKAKRSAWSDINVKVDELISLRMIDNKVKKFIFTDKTKATSDFLCYDGEYEEQVILMIAKNENLSGRIDEFEKLLVQRKVMGRMRVAGKDVARSG